MIYVTEKDIQGFQFWSDAERFVEYLNVEQFKSLGNHLDELCEKWKNNGRLIEETQVNNYVWFDLQDDEELCIELFGKTADEIVCQKENRYWSSTHQWWIPINHIDTDDELPF